MLLLTYWLRSLQEMRDLRVVVNTELNGVLPYPNKGRHQIYKKLDTVILMLQGRAKQLTLEGNYRDAEHIYTHILASPKLESRELEDLTLIEMLQNLVLIYERTGNLSAAEAAQEGLLRLAIDFRDHLEDEVILEAKKLHHFYVLFDNRIRNITVQHGDGQLIGADFAQMVIFLRVAALDIRSFNHLIGLIQIPNNALHIVVTAGAILLTTKLLHHSGCDVNTTDGDGNTALHIAVRESQARMVRLLVEVVDLEVVNEEGETALLLALKQTSEDAFVITKDLLDRGSDPSVTDSMGRTALHIAAGEGTPDLTKLVLSCGLDVDASDINGSTPLMIVAERSYSSDCVLIAQQLLESGANVNAADEGNGTPLIGASGFGTLETIQFLIARGANVESRDWFNRTALHRALERTAETEKEIISTLIEAQINIEARDNDGKSALGVALKRGDTAIARQLLEHGADVEAELEGERLLIHVVRLGNEPATKLLLERGANVQTGNKHGETPLIVAVSTGRESIVDVLLAHGADVEARDNKGETPLYIAVSQREHLILQALIRHGANVDSRNLGGYRPLDVAVAKVDGAVVRTLLKNGANVSTLSQVGNGQLDPLLHRVIYNSDLATVEMLLDAAPLIILTTDLKGNTPIHQAILEGREPHDRIFDFLLERFHGRNEILVALNGDGDTPLHLAVRLNRPGMAKSLLAAQSSQDGDENLCMQNLKGERVLDLFSSSLCSLALQRQLCAPRAEPIERIQQSLHDKEETIEREHNELVQPHLSISETAEGIRTMTPGERAPLGADRWMFDASDAIAEFVVK